MTGAVPVVLVMRSRRPVEHSDFGDTVVQRQADLLELVEFRLDDADRGFLTAGGVFTDDMIDGYIELKAEEVETLDMTTHPVEFDMYYSV